MVGVVGSSPIAPTKNGNKNKHLAETPSAFFMSVREKYGKAGLKNPVLQKKRQPRKSRSRTPHHHHSRGFDAADKLCRWQSGFC